MLPAQTPTAPDERSEEELEALAVCARTLVSEGADALEIVVQTANHAGTAPREGDGNLPPASLVAAVAAAVEVPLVAFAPTAAAARGLLRSGVCVLRIPDELGPGLAEAAGAHDAAFILEHDSRDRFDAGAGLDNAIDRLHGAATAMGKAGMAPNATWLSLRLNAGGLPGYARPGGALDALLDRGYPVTFDLAVGGPRPSQEDYWESAAAMASLAVAAGVHAVRVHDVKRLARVVRMADAMVHAGTAAFGASTTR